METKGKSGRRSAADLGMATGAAVTSPLISVCIPHYNGIDLIDACINSVRKQICDAAIEIIVHDDASTDGSAEYIRAHHPDVHLIASNENVGFCVANNRMAEIAKGEYLLLLNNDASLLPDALATLFHETRRLNCQAILTVPQYDANTDELIDIGCRLDPFLNPVPNLDAQRNDVGMVIGACLWIDKSLWNELGGFPGWFGSIGEDLYLCCRARLAGYPVRALGTSGYRHHVGQSFGGGKAISGHLVSSFHRRRLSERNKTYVMLLCLPSLRLWLTLPLHLILLAAEGVILLLVKRDKRLWEEIYAHVFTSLYHEAGTLRRERRCIQAQRATTSHDFGSVFTWVPRKLQLLIQYGVPTLR